VVKPSASGSAGVPGGILKHMDWGVVAVSVLVIALIGVLVWGSVLKRKRRLEIERMAVRHGFSFARGDFRDLLGRDVALFWKGDRRGVDNTVWGNWKGTDFVAADYWYMTESTNGKGGKSRRYYRFSVVVVEVPAYLPSLSIGPEDLLTRLADHVGMEDINFESEEFNRRFQIKARHRKFAFQFLDARLMNWFLSTEDPYRFEIGGQHLLLHCHRLRAGEIFPMIGTMQEFVVRIPQLVWDEYAIERSAGPAT
jgi:hypothetical protein